MAKGKKSQYTDEQKRSFVEIAMVARQAGRTWEQTHEAVSKAGFKSTLPYLQHLVKGPSVRQVARDLSRIAPRKRATSGAYVPGGSGDMQQIEDIVQSEVKKRVSAALREAIQVLERAEADHR